MKCKGCGFDMGEGYENCGGSTDGVCPECGLIDGTTLPDSDKELLYQLAREAIEAKLVYWNMLLNLEQSVCDIVRRERGFDVMAVDDLEGLIDGYAVGYDSSSWIDQDTLVMNLLSRVGQGGHEPPERKET